MVLRNIKTLFELQTHCRDYEALMFITDIAVYFNSERDSYSLVTKIKSDSETPLEFELGDIVDIGDLEDYMEQSPNDKCGELYKYFIGKMEELGRSIDNSSIVNGKGKKEDVK